MIPVTKVHVTLYRHDVVDVQIYVLTGNGYDVEQKLTRVKERIMWNEIQVLGLPIAPDTKLKRQEIEDEIDHAVANGNYEFFFGDIDQLVIL